MKTTFRILAAGLAASLALVSCDKESLTKTDNGATKDGVRTITVSFTATRSELDGYQPKFKTDDKIMVSNGSKSETCTVSVDDKGVASITINDVDLQTAALTAVYPASASSDGVTFTVASSQDGTFANANICKATISAGSKDAVFENKTAILKFSVPAKGDKGIDYSPTTIKVKSRGSNSIASGDSKEITISGTGTDGIITPSDGGFYYMAVLPGETISNLTVCSGEGMRCPTESSTLAANTIYDVALPVLNGHEYVELTIPVMEYDGFNFEYHDTGSTKTLKWATKNVGASSPTEHGEYFFWGETTGHSAATTGENAFLFGTASKGFSWSNTPFNNGQSSYNETYFGSVKDTVCPDGVLASSYDAATQNWGSTWRMPTREEFAGLAALDSEKKGWDNINMGYRLTDENINSIFFPAAGCGSGTDLDDAGVRGYYWSSSLDTDGPSTAHYFVFDGGYISVGGTGRYFGYSVRPVSVSN